MNKNIELNLACYKLMQAIRNGNKPLSNADFAKKWEDFNLLEKKLKNLRKAK